MLKHLFKRPTLGLISWLLLISFYLATFLNIAFYKQVLQETAPGFRAQPAGVFVDAGRRFQRHEHCADAGLIPVA